jgi:3-hydroxyisobutyrate dehydrogenase-like beta-hydroxyacid dehydrogenase
MIPVVAVVAAGNMGAAVARRLSEHGVKVLTTLAGRGDASVARAAAAAMTDVPLDRLTEAEIVLSILPPAHALSFAEQMAPLLLATERKPVFVDCNAVSPQTARQIGAAVAATGAPFVDASIIGLPPKPGQASPRLYASGESAARMQVLREYGLDVRVLDGPVGAASAL